MVRCLATFHLSGKEGGVGGYRKQDAEDFLMSIIRRIIESSGRYNTHRAESNRMKILICLLLLFYFILFKNFFFWIDRNPFQQLHQIPFHTTIVNKCFIT